MADLALRAIVEGTQQATSDLQSIIGKIEQAQTTDSEWASVQARLKAAGEELRTEHEKRAQALQNLKDHTAALVQKQLDQEAAQAAAAATGESMANSLASMAVKAVAAIFTIDQIVKVFGQMITSGHEAAVTQVRMEAVLTATGLSAGFTSAKLDEMARKFAESTRFDDTGIKKAMSVLLTFRDVQGEVFEGAIKQATNLSEMFGSDLPSAARQLGRALEDPAHGMDSLRRIGIVLTETQKEQIKTMQEHGDLMGAQKLLLDALDKSMGGVAETLGGSAVTASDRFKKAWGELLEELGKPPTKGSVWSQILDMGAGALNAARDLVSGGYNPERRAAEFTLMNPASSVDAQDRAFAILQAAEQKARDEKKKADDAQALAEEIALGHGYERKLELQRAAQKKGAQEADKAFQDDIKRIELLHQAQRISDDEYIVALDEAAEHYRENTTQRLQLEVKLQQFLEKLAQDEATTKKRAWDDFVRHVKDQERELEQADTDRHNEGMKMLQASTRANTDAARTQIAGIKNTVHGHDEQRAAVAKLIPTYEDMGVAGSGAVRIINQELGKMPTAADIAGKKMVAALDTAYNAMIGSASHAVTQIVFGHQSMGEAIKSIMSGTTSFVESIFETMVSSILHGFTDGLFSPLRAAAESFGKYLSNTISSWFGGDSSGIGGGIMSSAGSWLGGIFGGGGGGSGSPIDNYGADESLGGGGGSGIGTVAGAAIGSMFGMPTVGAAAGTFIGNLFGFATGGDKLVTSPSLMMVGETGPERVTVSPIAGAAHGGMRGGESISVNFSGPAVLDTYSERRFAQYVLDIVRRGY